MASEVTTTSANDLSYSAMILASNIIDALYPLLNARNLVRYESLAGLPSKAHDFPFTPKLAAAAVAEGVDLSNTPFSTTKQTVTASEVGILLTITDVLDVSDIVSNAYYATEAAKAVADKINTDIAALATGFSQTTGSTGVNLSEQNILDGITTLMAANVPGPYKALIHPQQWNDFAAGIGATVTPAQGGGEMARTATNEFGFVPDGGLGRFYGVDWWITAAVPTANSGADRAGMLVSSNRAIGFVEKWAARVEMERDISLRATEVAVTTMYGVAELDDTSGVGVITDA